MSKKRIRKRKKIEKEEGCIILQTAVKMKLIHHLMFMKFKQMMIAQMLVSKIELIKAI